MKNIERYLLFDSGCGTCSNIATEIEKEADGWLLIRSLNNPKMQHFLDQSKPNWQWEPTLLIVDNDQKENQVFTGFRLIVKMIQGLGFRKTWHLGNLIS